MVIKPLKYAGMIKEMDLKCHLILINLNLCCYMWLVATVLNSLVLDILSSLWTFIHFFTDGILLIINYILSMNKNTVNSLKFILEVYPLEHFFTILATS